MSKLKKNSLRFHGKPEMAKTNWNDKAISFDMKMNRHLGSIKVLLLGPGYPKGQLKIRTDVAKKLEKDGCDIYIMEKMKPIRSYNIDEKFGNILSEIKPDLIIPIFTEEGAPHGVIFEVGFICGQYGTEEALSRLRFCFHEKIKKVKNTPAYLHTLVSRTRYYEFCDKNVGPTLYDRIIQFIRDEVVRQYCPTDLPENEKPT